MTDKNLNFIYSMEDLELDDLVKLLSNSITESLTSTVAYKNNYPHHSKYVPEIIREFRADGGNTFANLFRGGEGPSYKEIVCDVADRFGVNYNKDTSVERIEAYLIQKIWSDAVEKMSYEEKVQCFKELGLKNGNVPISEALNTAAIVAFRLGGFASYKIAVIVVNAVWKFLFGRGLSFVADAALTKTLSIWAGPIGWAITAVWTAIDIAGPAYRITIPAVLNIIMLRQKFYMKTNSTSYEDVFRQTV